MSIFDKRINFRPYEYPEINKYKDAIRHSYWIHTEFNVTSDIQDYKVNIDDVERDIIKKTMLAISQIEVSVKTFWAKIYDKMPKPEIAGVGFTFAESEERHSDAYAFLLEKLGLNDEFKNIYSIPAIIDRVNYLQKDLNKYRKPSFKYRVVELLNDILGTSNLFNLKKLAENENKKYALSILLFSVFIEHISLFSQFLIMMSFDKHKKIFKGISNIVEATSKEEDIHGKFGLEIVNILKKEHPKWFDNKLEKEIIRACKKAEKAERKVLDWIFEKGELEFLPKKNIEHFIKNRFNNSLKSLNIEPIFEVDSDLIKDTLWFDEKIISTKDNDFFNKRTTAYSKKTKSITEDDLF